MKLLIDTNVILDMVFLRNGCDNSMKLFRKIRENGDSAYITASSVTDLFYIIRKEMQDAFVQKWKDYADASLPVRTPAA